MQWRWSAALAGLSIATICTAQVANNPHRPTPTFDRAAPHLPRDLRNAVLIVSKTNGWRHLEHIPHSNAVIAGLARDAGRRSFTTENAAVFNDRDLARFAVVVLNSASGDFLTPNQRAAFARYLAGGGGIVALHAAADGSHVWPDYRSMIVGADYAGHPGGDRQFQPAKIIVERPDHPVMAGVGRTWTPIDEWYSYKTSPRAAGMTVLATIDEASYAPGAKLAMGADHPVIWTNTRGKGRILVSKLGHQPQAYDDPNYRRIIANALRWTAKRPQ